MDIVVPSPAGNAPSREGDSVGDADAHLAIAASSSKRRREQDHSVSDPAQAGSALVGDDDDNAAMTAADSAEDEDGLGGRRGGDGDDVGEASERTVVISLLVEKVLHGGFQIGAAYCEGCTAPTSPVASVARVPRMTPHSLGFSIFSPPALRHR